MENVTGRPIVLQSDLAKVEKDLTELLVKGFYHFLLWIFRLVFATYACQNFAK